MTLGYTPAALVTLDGDDAGLRAGCLAEVGAGMEMMPGCRRLPCRGWRGRGDDAGLARICLAEVGTDVEMTPDCRWLPRRRCYRDGDDAGLCAGCLAMVFSLVGW